MVGGRILSKTPKGDGIIQLWCVEAQNGSTDECAVDRRELEKVGYSYDPTRG